MAPIRIVDAGQETAENVVVTLYSPPGLGKTTLAFTAEKPLLFDFDGKAVKAVAAVRAGKGLVQARSWKDVAGLEEGDLAAYQTVVIDTAGTLLDKLMLDINSSGNLKIQEYSELGSRFKLFVSKLRMWRKDVVFIAHGSEEQRGDTTVDRIQAAGNIAKNLIYQQSDIIGRLYLNAEDERVLSFNPTATSFGKNVGTGLPVMTIPEATASMDALARIIAQAKHLMNEAAAEQQEVGQRLDVARSSYQGFSTVEQFNEELAKLLGRGANRTERQMLLEVAQAKGMHYDKDAKTFVLPAAEQQEAAAEVGDDDPFA